MGKKKGPPIWVSENHHPNGRSKWLSLLVFILVLFGIQVFFGIYFGGILKFWYFGGISNVVIIERSLCIEQSAIS